MIDSILPFVLSHAILFYGLCYTKPQSLQRPLLAGLIITFCVISARSSIAQAVPGLVGGEYSIGFAFHSSQYLLLARLTPPFPASASPSGRRAWSFSQIFTARWGVAYIPSWDRKRSGYVPSRKRFLQSRLWDVTWTAACIYLHHYYPLYVELDDFTGVPNGFLRRMHDVSAREAVVRLYITLGGLLEVYCALRGLYSVASLVGVVLFDDAPVCWPPLFGSLKDAYSLRRYYSHFWHHLMRKAFTAHARFLATRLGFRQRGLITRYTIIILTFLCSTALHIASAPVPLRCGVIPQLHFYASVVAAIAAEDLVLRTAQPWLSLKSSKGQGRLEGKLNPEVTTPRTCERQPIRASGEAGIDSDDDAPAMWARLVGHVWVVLFFTWAASKLIYRTQSCMYRAAEFGYPRPYDKITVGNSTLDAESGVGFAWE